MRVVHPPLRRTACISCHLSVCLSTIWSRMQSGVHCRECAEDQPSYTAGDCPRRGSEKTRGEPETRKKLTSVEGIVLYFLLECLYEWHSQSCKNVRFARNFQACTDTGRGVVPTQREFTVEVFHDPSEPRCFAALGGLGGDDQCSAQEALRWFLKNFPQKA